MPIPKVIPRNKDTRQLMWICSVCLALLVLLIQCHRLTSYSSEAQGRSCPLDWKCGLGCTNSVIVDCTEQTTHGIEELSLGDKHWGYTHATRRLKYHKKPHTNYFNAGLCELGHHSHLRPLRPRCTGPLLWFLHTCETNISLHPLSRRGKHGCPDPEEAHTCLEITLALNVLTTHF